MSTEDQSRSEFEARSQHSKRLLWKRGGSVFAENIPESDYVDVGVQRDWLLWHESWQASRRTERAAQAQPIRMEKSEGNTVQEMRRNLSAKLWSSGDCIVCWVNEGDYYRALAVETKEG